jgi:hypothetical protein
MGMEKMAALALVGALAACGGKPAAGGNEGSAAPLSATGPVSGDEAATMIDKVRMKPGQWTIDFSMKAVDIQGVPPQQRDMMLKAMSGAMQAHKIDDCITPEEAAKPSASFFAGQRENNCRYANMTMGGGTMAADISCRNPKGDGSMTARLKGSYTPASYDMTMDMTVSGMGAGEGPASGMTMVMSGHSGGRWVGPQCKPEKG